MQYNHEFNYLRRIIILLATLNMLTSCGQKEKAATPKININLQEFTGDQIEAEDILTLMEVIKSFHSQQTGNLTFSDITTLYGINPQNHKSGPAIVEVANNYPSGFEILRCRQNACLYKAQSNSGSNTNFSPNSNFSMELSDSIEMVIHYQETSRRKMIEVCEIKGIKISAQGILPISAKADGARVVIENNQITEMIADAGVFGSFPKNCNNVHTSN